MEETEIIEKINELREKINEETLEKATAKQLAKYLVEVDKLSILMAKAIEKKN